MEHKRTPNGGDYSKVLYVDSEGKLTTSENATKIIVQEFSKDGRLLQETICLPKGTSNTCFK